MEKEKVVDGGDGTAQPPSTPRGQSWGPECRVGLGPCSLRAPAGVLLVPGRKEACAMTVTVSGMPGLGSP